MPETLSNIKLDTENLEFNNAAEFVRHTDKLVYLTGKAGTGKTTFLKYIKETTNKNTVILAPTGVAAINAGGVTIHSFFQMPFGPFVPDDSRLRTNSVGAENGKTIYTTFKYREDKREIIENLELLIIDEISMVRADTLDVIDRILKVFRRKPYLPFGGVQVILIGDTFQLPPIADNEQWRILSQFYKTPFFFSSKIIEQNTPLYIELKKIYRQNEQEFIDLLNRIRVSQVTQNDFTTLNAKYNPTFSGKGSDYIILATHNIIVNETNLTKLNQIEAQLYTYEAKVIGTFPDKHKPTDQNLNLKIGAQIMFVKNDTGEHRRYFNGKIGKIKELEEGAITVVFDNDTEVKVEKAIWENIQYSYDKETKKITEEVIGTFEQFPIRLAWAITVHKSQGLTFEKVIADLEGAFAPGQVYVALSRCTTFNGLMLKSQIIKSAIKTDPRVIEFAKNETPETLITEQLNTGKADFFYKKAREEFGKGNIKSAFDYFKSALKFRNDIDTETFQRYIEIKTKRLLSKNTKSTFAENKLIKSLKELEEANNKIFELDKKVEHYMNSCSEYEISLGSIGKEYLEIEKKNSNLTYDIQTLKNTSSVQEEKVTQLKSSVTHLRNELDSKNETLNEFENKLKLKTAEVKYFAKRHKEIDSHTLSIALNVSLERLRLYCSKLGIEISNDKKRFYIPNESIRYILTTYIEEERTKQEIEENKLTNEIEKLKEEITRLEKLKWYEKLFKKK